MATVNINEAGKKELAEAEDIGSVLAERILEHRQKNGSFTEKGDLLEVKGIGENRLNQIQEKNEIIVERSSPGFQTVVGSNESRDLCPAIQDCPFYLEEYCQQSYEECARYRIVLSDLDSNEYLFPNLLPTDHEKADRILEENG